MPKKITLAFSNEEWNFLYNMQTVSFIGSYRNPSSSPISDILKAIINNKPTFNSNKELYESLKSVKQEMKRDVDEEIRRLGSLGYSKGNYVLNLDDYTQESLLEHINRYEKEKNKKLTESKMVKLLLRDQMEDIIHSIMIGSHIYTSVLFGMGADGLVLIESLQNELMLPGSYNSKQNSNPNNEHILKIRPPLVKWAIEWASLIKKDLPIVKEFFKLLIDRGFPGDFVSYAAERKKHWSIVSYFNYVTALAGLIASLRILIYPTSWVPDLIFGSFYERLPVNINDSASLMFMLEIYNLMHKSVFLSCIRLDESEVPPKLVSYEKFPESESKDLEDIRKLLDEYLLKTGKS
jgi:hypothetical protein